MAGWDDFIAGFQRGMAGASQQAEQGLDRTSRAGSRAHATFAAMNNQLGTFIQRIIAPGAAVWALQRMSRSLDDLAQGSMQLRNMATNLHMTTREILDMRQAMERMGYTSQQSSSQVSSFASRMKELQTFGRASELFKDLRAMGGEEFAQRFQRLADRPREALRELTRVFQQEGPRVRSFLSQIFGIDEAVLEQMEDAQRRNIEIFQMDEALSKRWVNDKVTMAIRIQNVFGRVSEEMIRQFYNTAGESDKLGERLEDAFSRRGVQAVKDFADWLRENVIPMIQQLREGGPINVQLLGHVDADFRKVIKWLMEEPDPTKVVSIEIDETLLRLFRWLTGDVREDFAPANMAPLGDASTLMQRMQDEGPSLTPAQRDLRRLRRAFPGDPRGGNIELPGGGVMPIPGGPVQPMSFTGQPIIVPGRIGGPRGSGLPDLQANVTQARLVDIESDSNRILGEIRDTLQGRLGPSNQPTTTAAPGTGGGVGGGAGRGPTFREGIGPGRGTGPQGETRADRNNNPGNIKFGPFAKSMGATGADDAGFAVFPDRETGFKAAEGLLGSKSYEGLNLGQIGSRWAAGDPNWAKNVSRATGIPTEAVPTPEQRGAIARQGIPTAEGTGRGVPSATGRRGGVRSDASGIPSEVLSKAREVAHLGPGALQQFMANQGYPMHSAWCGDFAASVVKASGGTPPHNPQIASNWRNWGREVDEPQPGDIAVRSTSRFGGGARVRTGEVGSHVNIVESVGDRSFRAIGGNQSRRTATFPRSQYQFYRGADAEDARRKIDQVAAENRQKLGTADINVNVNAPRGTKVDADADGVFQKIRTNRSPQMPKASGQGQEWQWQNTLTD